MSSGISRTESEQRIAAQNAAPLKENGGALP